MVTCQKSILYASGLASTFIFTFGYRMQINELKLLQCLAVHLCTYQITKYICFTVPSCKIKKRNLTLEASPAKQKGKKKTPADSDVKQQHDDQLKRYDISFERSFYFPTKLHLYVAVRMIMLWPLIKYIDMKASQTTLISSTSFDCLPALLIKRKR